MLLLTRMSVKAIDQAKAKWALATGPSTCVTTTGTSVAAASQSSAPT